MTNDGVRVTGEKRARRRWMWGVAALIVLALLVLPASYVSVAEGQNVFCTSCHLKPEQMYYDRSLVKSQENAADLATWHAQAGVNCVGCHRGDQGLRDRVVAWSLGARNTGKFVLRQYDPNHTQVAVRFLLSDSCLRCHITHPELGGVKPGQPNPVMVGGFDNHFHTLLFDPPTRAKTSVTCGDCHPAHREGFPELQFMDRTRRVLPTCERCHQELGRGPAKGLQ